MVATPSHEVPIPGGLGAIPRLSPALDAQFGAFYRAYADGTGQSPAAFDAAAFEFFEGLAAAAPLEAAGASDNYFNCFTLLWQRFLAAGRILPALAVWEWALRAPLAWEAAGGARLHKGSAFYFAAGTSLLAGDVDSGFLMAHAALGEDIATHGSDAPLTPSLALVALDPTPVAQLFRDWVVYHAHQVDSWLGSYRSRHAKHLELELFRSKYLLRIENRENAFLFSYGVARLVKLKTMGAHATSGVFAGQLKAQLLFDLALLVDQAIPSPSSRRPLFMGLALHLSSSSGLGLLQKDFEEINARFKADFNGTAEVLLDGGLTLGDGRSVTGLASALAIAYGCRNRGAHTTATMAISDQRFDELATALIDCLFLAVETFGEAATSGLADGASPASAVTTGDLSQ